MSVHELSELIITKPEAWDELLADEALTQDDFIEIYADFRDLEAFGKKVKGYLREVVNARLIDDEHITKHNVKVVRTHRVRKGGLDRELILEEMGEEWVEEHSKPDTEYDELRVSRIMEEED